MSNKVDFFSRFEAVKLFSEKEAWFLFKYTAIGEAIGWTLLLYGIAARKYTLPGHKFALAIGGSVHGILFLAYLGVILAAYTSLNWSRRKGFLAVMVSVIPFGSLIFEQWASTKRREEQQQTRRLVVVKAIISDGGKATLALQPSYSSLWSLPGGEINDHETAEQAIARLITNFFGIRPKVGTLMYVCHRKDSIEFYFKIENYKAFKKLDTNKIIESNSLVDELEFVITKGNKDIEPEFLQTIIIQPKQIGSDAPVFIIDN